MTEKHLSGLDGLTPAEETTCHGCRVELTDQNRTAWEQIRGDGKTQGLCQNCWRQDDVVDLREISPL